MPTDCCWKLSALLLSFLIAGLPAQKSWSAVKGDGAGQISPKSFYLTQLIQGAPAVMKSYIEDTGRFRSAEGWCVDNQEVIYPLAFLATYQDPKNPYAGDGKLLEMALRGGDAIVDSQYEDGSVEYLTNEGFNWGRVYLHETLTAWLETYQLLKDRLSQDRRVRWERGIIRMVEGIHQQVLGNRNPRLYSGIFHDEDVIWGWSGFLTNSRSVWDGLNLYTAGRIFERKEWEQNRQRLIHSSLETMDPLGFWPEFGGPSSSANLDYLQAVGLYYENSGDLAVVPYLQRAVSFHANLVYPDGALIETFDARARYHEDVMEPAHFTLSQFAEGRRLASYLVSQMKQRNSSPSFSAHLLRNFRYYHDGAEAKLAFDKKGFVSAAGNRALNRRKDGWFYALSGFTFTPTKNRWALDRQNFLSVWNEQTGVIITGGNSKGQADWSNFVFSRGGRPVYVPTAADVQGDKSKDRVILEYGSRKGILELSPKSKKELRITASVADPSDAAVAQFVLNVQAGSSLKTAAGEIFSLSERYFEVKGEDAGGSIQYGTWSISLPPGSKVAFPSFPYQPDDRQGRARLSEARAILSFPIDSNHPSTTLTVTLLDSAK